MSQPQSNPLPPDSRSHLQRVAGWIANGLRVVLIAAIVVASVYMVRGWWGLVSEWRMLSRPPVSRQSSAADFNSMAAVLPLAGQWSFAELDWNLKSNAVDPAEIVPRFESLAAAVATDRDGQLPDVSPELVAMATELKIEPVERGGNQIYRLDKPDLKAQFVARTVGGKPKAVGLAVAFPQQERRWQLLELTPRAAKQNLIDAQPSLLPLPPDAERSGGRFADDGTLLLELVKLKCSGSDLIAQWKEAGWDVRPSGMGGPEDFTYLCAQGDEVIYAWSADSQGALEDLMLVRTSEPVDTKPSE